jgi:hypothetical protein
MLVSTYKLIEVARFRASLKSGFSLWAAIFFEKLVPIPIAKGPISAGSPRDVPEDPDGVAIIHRDWPKIERILPLLGSRVTA